MRAPADREHLERLLQTLGRSIHRPVRFYLVGGSVLVDLGLREATLDVDYVAQADDPSALADLERLLPRLKDELNVNLEPASPSDFMPVPSGVIERSPYVRSYGPWRSTTTTTAARCWSKWRARPSATCRTLSCYCGPALWTGPRSKRPGRRCAPVTPDGCAIPQPRSSDGWI